MWAEERIERKWFFPVRIDRSARLARWLKGGTHWNLMGGLGGLKERNQISGDFIVEAEVSERMRKRRKELSDRAIGSEVRRRCARLKGDIVNIIKVQNN